jgi:DNA-directed RNA polymerase specialized sigma24 family protein
MPQPLKQQQTATLTPSAFAQAYVKGLRQTTKFLISKGAALDLAEEVAQGAWVRGWEARDQLHLKDRLLPWVNTIAFHSLCADHRRSVRNIELTEVADGRSPEPVAALDAGILMKRCSPLEKVLLTQRYVAGMGLKAIALTHGLSEIAVRLRIHRCKCGLRSSLAGRSFAA